MSAGQRPLWMLQVDAAALLYEWSTTTHGNEFGHDHHCPLRDNPDGPWAGTVTIVDVERCSDGWAAFRMAHDAVYAARGREA